MVMLFLWKPHQMVQNPEARNLDPINNTSCSPMVPVQPCYIAEWKKMAGKNKKLIKKLEAKQKKLYNENSFHQSVLCLHTNKAGKTTETWHTGRQGNMKFIPDHWKKHIKDITGGKMTTIFQGLARKPDKEGNSMIWIKKTCHWISGIYNSANLNYPVPATI